MSVDRIKTAIEKIDRGLRVMEGRAQTGVFDRAQERRERQQQRDEELQGRLRAESEARQRGIEELEALKKQYEELSATHASLGEQLRGQPGSSESHTPPTANALVDATEVPESERFRNLKGTHKALKYKHEKLSGAAANAIGRMDEILASAGADSAQRSETDG